MSARNIVIITISTIKATFEEPGCAFCSNIFRCLMISTQPNIGLLLVHRLRRWPNIKQTLGDSFVFTELAVFDDLTLTIVTSAIVRENTQTET